MSQICINFAPRFIIYLIPPAYPARIYRKTGMNSELERLECLVELEGLERLEWL